MNVNGISGAGMQTGAAGRGIGGGQMDTESKNLQQQIDRLQQQLKEVSANQDMPADTKMKKRQDIQKQISELQIQLRQHQIEARKEERQKKKRNLPSTISWAQNRRKSRAALRMRECPQTVCRP